MTNQIMKAITEAMAEGKAKGAKGVKVVMQSPFGVKEFDIEGDSFGDMTALYEKMKEAKEKKEKTKGISPILGLIAQAMAKAAEDFNPYEDDEDEDETLTPVEAMADILETVSLIEDEKVRDEFLTLLKNSPYYEEAIKFLAEEEEEALKVAAATCNCPKCIKRRSGEHFSKTKAELLRRHKGDLGLDSLEDLAFSTSLMELITNAVDQRAKSLEEGLEAIDKIFEKNSDNPKIKDLLGEAGTIFKEFLQA